MQSVLRVVVFFGITVTVLAAAEAQTITRQGSGVIARFASQNGAARRAWSMARPQRSSG